MKRRGFLIFMFLWATVWLSGQGAFSLITGRYHPELKWSVYETENFCIIFSNGLEHAAVESGRIAEQLYRAHKENLGLSFKKKYPFFISDVDDIANGATSNLRYFFIYLNPLDCMAHFTGRQGWLERVIGHEMVHALIFENTRSHWDFFFPFSAVQTLTYHDFNEGMAQFYAGEEWGLERGDRYLNLGIRNSDLSVFPGQNDFGRLTYAQGFAKVKWLRRELEDKKIGEIFHLKKKWSLYSFNSNFKKTTGRSYEDFTSIWRRAMNVYFNWREAVSERTEETGELLKGIICEHVSVIKESPDGRMLAWTGFDRIHDRRLFLLDKESKKTRVLAKNGILENFSFSPDSRMIAFARRHYGKHGSVISDLFRVDLETGKEIALTGDFRCFEPGFVSDGSIVFIRNDGNATNLYRCNPDGESCEKLTAFNSERYLLDLAVSPDGKSVMTSFQDPLRRMYGILLYTIENGRAREFPTPSLCRFPLFSPDGSEEILCTGQENNVSNILRFSPEGPMEKVTAQSNYLLVTQWITADRALGIRQICRETVEPFVMDPSRRPRTFNAELQPYYREWRTSTPGVPVLLSPGKISGEFKGPFHSLSTFRLLNLMPFPFLQKGRFSLGFQALGSDMLGKNQIFAGAALDFKQPGDSDFLLAWENHSTPVSLSLQAGRQDTAVFRYFAEKASYEQSVFADLIGTVPFAGVKSYSKGRFSLGVHFERSDPELPDADATLSGLLLPPAFFQTAGFSFSAQMQNVAPYSDFPFQGSGAGIRLQYHFSIPGKDFSYFHGRAGFFYLVPFGEWLQLYVTAAMEMQSGTAPPQRAVGMAYYRTFDTYRDYSEEIYIRGGERYHPGDRLLTASMELQLPLFAAVRNVLFIDYARVWEGKGIGWNGGESFLSYGSELQISLVFDKNIMFGAGAVRNVSQRPAEKWKFYLTLKQVLPF